MSRYERNFPVFSVEDFNKIQNASVGIVGCGDLGGYIIELLARIGVGSLTLIDGDHFTESNLNRQLLCTEKNLGTSKVKAGVAHIKQINSKLKTQAHPIFLSEENGHSLIKDCDIMMDALDTIPSRLVLQRLCRQKNTPLVHGAIGGWFGQVTTVFPEDDTLSRLYSEEKRYDLKSMGNPSFTPALVASIQVSECLKVISKKEDLLRNKLLYIDLLYNDFCIFNI